MPGRSTPERGALKLVHSSDHALNENNLARAAIWWLAPMQVPIWEAMELSGFSARVTGIPPELGNLTVFDAEVMVVLQTWLGRQPAEERRHGRIVYSLRELWRELGHEQPPNALERERLRRSLERLTYATIERDWWDAGRGEEVHQVRRLIADADFIKKGRPGQFGRAMRGFVALAPELVRQLEAQQFAYALDLPTLLDLPTPLAQRLYLFLAGDAMRPMKSDPKLVAYRYPLGARLYENLGISDTNHRRLRLKIARAAEEIRLREPLYRKLALEPLARRRGWKLEVVRERGRSRAPERRRALTEQAARAEGRHIARRLAPPLSGGVDVSAPTAGHGDWQRWQAASIDPRVMTARARWMAEASRPGDEHERAIRELAWREYHRDLRAWVIAGEPDPSPRAPELD